MGVAAFVMCEEVPSLGDDDRMTADVLFTRDVTVQAVRSDAPGIDWAGFAAVVIRSTWDYHLRPDCYRQWLRDRAADGIRRGDAFLLMEREINEPTHSWRCRLARPCASRTPSWA